MFTINRIGKEVMIQAYVQTLARFFFKSLSKTEYNHKQNFPWLRLYHVIHQFGRKMSPVNTTFMNLALVAELLTCKNNKSRKEILEKNLLVVGTKSSKKQEN